MSISQEILSDLDLLRSPHLDLSRLMLDGIQFGSHVDQFPRSKITEVTFAPIVRRQSSTIDAETEYFDASGNPLSLDEVIDSAFQASGFLRIDLGLRVKVADGHVVGFVISGDWLKHFHRIKSFKTFVKRFGQPDRIQVLEPYLGLGGEFYHYYEAKKLVSWDHEDRCISFIALGGYEDHVEQKPDNTMNPDPTSTEGLRSIRNSPFGLIALILGLLLLGVALLYAYLGPIEPPPSLKSVLLDKAMRLKDAGSSVEASTWGPDRIFGMSVIGSGLVAIVLVIVSFLRQENTRLILSATAVVVAAMLVHVLPGLLMLSLAIVIVVFAIFVLSLFG